MVLETQEQIADALRDYPVEDLWGVGRQHSHKLIRGGIETAAQFRALPIDWVQTNMTIVGVRMWRELWGESCIPLKTVLDPKKGMCTSRAFGQMTGDYSQLKEATSSYAARLAVKLRREKLCTSVISVRLLTNRFKSEASQAYPCITIPLDHPVNNTIDLVRTALLGLKKIYMRGYLFQKVEVTATGLIPEEEVQLNLFNKFEGVKHDQISRVLDRLNMHYGAVTLRMAGAGINQKWSMKREFLRPNYTTDWNDIIKVK
jgi:DNA polymerase V